MVENGVAEYKSEYTETIAKSVVAFSNSGEGTILIGVDDLGNTVGLDDVDDTALKCVQLIRDQVRPDVSSTTSIDIVKRDSKDVVKITVFEGIDKPYFLRSKGLRAEGVYVRRGPSSVQVTEQQFNKMIRNARSIAYEDILSRDQSLTFSYAENVFKKSGLSLDEVHKSILGLKTDSGYTNLGFLISDHATSRSRQRCSLTKNGWVS